MCACVFLCCPVSERRWDVVVCETVSVSVCVCQRMCVCVCNKGVCECSSVQRRASLPLSLSGSCVTQRGWQIWSRPAATPPRVTLDSCVWARRRRAECGGGDVCHHPKHIARTYLHTHHTAQHTVTHLLSVLQHNTHPLLVCSRGSRMGTHTLQHAHGLSPSAAAQRVGGTTPRSTRPPARKEADAAALAVRSVCCPELLLQGAVFCCSRHTRWACRRKRERESLLKLRRSTEHVDSIGVCILVTVLEESILQTLHCKGTLPSLSAREGRLGPGWRNLHRSTSAWSEATRRGRPPPPSSPPSSLKWQGKGSVCVGRSARAVPTRL